MSAALSATVWLTAIGCALMAGVYLTFSSFVMRSLDALPEPGAVAAMQSINREILSSGFMPLFFGTSLASLALGYWVSPYWFLLTAFAGLNMFQAAFTGFCPAAMIFKAIGVRDGPAFK